MRLKGYPNLEFLDYEQGSLEWFVARFGSGGSSEYKTMIANGRNGGPSKTRQALMQKKIRESVTGEPESWGENSSTRWGHYYEDEARRHFSEVMELDVATVGVVKNRLYPGIHSSPDGLIFAADGIYPLEIKCLQWAAACKNVLLAQNPAWNCPTEHRLQCRHHSIIAGGKGCFFVSYYPKKKALEILGPDAKWEQVLRFVPAPSAAEVQEHIAGLKAWNHDYAEMLPQAAQLVKDYRQAQKQKENNLQQAMLKVAELNKSLIERIS